MTPEPVVLYGDFNCPWSYLASRRARALQATAAPGGAPRRGARPVATRARTGRASTTCARRWTGSAPSCCPARSSRTRSPASCHARRPRSPAYAEAYAAGVAPLVRDLLFEAFWLHGLDIGDPKVVRTLLVDAIRSGSSPSEPLRDWGSRSTSPADPSARRRGGWSAPGIASGAATATRWCRSCASRGATIVGVDAVRWLGDQLREAGSPAGRSAGPPAQAAPWRRPRGRRSTVVGVPARQPLAARLPPGLAAADPCMTGQAPGARTGGSRALPCDDDQDGHAAAQRRLGPGGSVRLGPGCSRCSRTPAHP